MVKKTKNVTIREADHILSRSAVPRLQSNVVLEGGSKNDVSVIIGRPKWKQFGSASDDEDF